MIYGKKSFQSLFKKLYSFSLKGMNYGIVGSGENNVLKNLYFNSKKPVVFDVGANIGEYSQLLLNNLGDNVQIYAFEPSESTFQELNKNIKHANLHTFNLGLGLQVEDVKLYKDKDLSTIASVFQRSVKEHEFLHFEIIRIVSLDHFCQEQNIEYIDFLKIDVEGNEIGVLKGASKLLENKKIKQIQFEFGGSQIDARAYFKDFWEILSPNYNIYRVLNNGLEPIKTYNERLEIFSYANYFTSLKP